MNAKKLFAAVIVSTCASAAFAAAPEVNFSNTLTPYEVTAQNTAGAASSVGSEGQAKNAGAGEQAMQAVNFANSQEPWQVTAQSAAKSGQISK